MNKKFALKLVKDKAKDLLLPAKNTVGETNVKYPINVFTEFAPIKAVVMGYMGDSSQVPNCPTLIHCCPEVVVGPYSTKIIKRAQVIQNQISEIFAQHGVHVVRPGDIDNSIERDVEGYKVKGFQTYNARDILFYYHDSVYECPTTWVSRQYESEAFNWISDQQRELGSKWYKSWKGYFKLEGDPMWDAANIMRVGLDLVFLISYGGNEAGYRFFKNHIKELYGDTVRVHPVRNLYDGFHIDSTLVTLGYNKVLQKNVLLANPSRATPTNIPVIFRGKNWVVLESPEIIDNGFDPGFKISTKWIGQNILVMNPQLVMIDEKQKPLINMLKLFGIDSVAVPNEIGRNCSGGIHCMTNDYHREEEIDFASIIRSPHLHSSKEKSGYFDEEFLTFLQSQGPIDDWEEISNKNGIFPTYFTDHLSQVEKSEMLQRHEQEILKYKSKNKL